MKWVYDLKVRTKLIAAFTIVAAITAIVGFMGIRNMGTMNQMASKMYKNELLGLSYMKEANVDLISIGRAEKNLLLASTDAEREKHRASMKNFEQSLMENMDKARPLIHTAKGKAQLAQFDKLWSNYVEVHDNIAELGLQEELQKKRQSVEMAFGIGRQTADEIDQLMMDMTKVKEDNAKEAATHTDEIYDRSRVFMVILVLGGVLFGLGLGLFISKIIGNPLNQMAAAADKISEGDINVKIDYESKDEIGILAGSFRRVVDTLQMLCIEDGGAALQSAANKDLTVRVKRDYKGVYDEMKENINSLLDTLEDGMVQVASASSTVLSSSQELAATSAEVGKASQSIAETINQVAAGSQEQSKMVATASTSLEQLSQAIEEVSKGAQSQASTVEETVALVQQITAAIESVARTAQSAANASLEVAEVAKSGGESVEKSVQGMARIKETTDNVATAVVQLGENSKQIGAIVETIDDIAEQTNLLALNAAIEAARAGEHGKGFAVVADEVRKLAERSSMATKEIADLIGNIQQMTEHAVEAMQSGTAEVEAGTELAAQAGEALSGIQSAVNGIVRQIEEMSAATQQMSASSAEVVKAVENVSAITEESTAATEEMAASSTEVTKAVEQVASVSEESAASAEEVSAAAEEQNASVEEMSASAMEMAKIAEDLQSLVSQFKVSNAHSAPDLRVVEGKAKSQSVRRAA